MALRLHAVTPVDSANGRPSTAGGVHLIPFRDLAAVVSPRDKFSLDEPDDALANAHRLVVDAFFRKQIVLPAPAGVVFRTEHVLEKWMELHYVALNDALAFVADRAAARVHVRRLIPSAEDIEPGSELAESAIDIFRTLSRKAVASVSLSAVEVPAVNMRGAFLAERDLWKDFTTAVAEVVEANPKLVIELTGPWAPYDFVHMQFGD